MSKKWPFKKSPGVVVTALIEDVEDLTDFVDVLSRRTANLLSAIDHLEEDAERDRKFCATHHHTTYWPRPNEDDGLGDIGPVL